MNAPNAPSNIPSYARLLWSAFFVELTLFGLFFIGPEPDGNGPSMRVVVILMFLCLVGVTFLSAVVGSVAKRAGVVGSVWLVIDVWILLPSFVLILFSTGAAFWVWNLWTGAPSPCPPENASHYFYRP